MFASEPPACCRVGHSDFRALFLYYLCGRDTTLTHFWQNIEQTSTCVAAAAAATAAAAAAAAAAAFYVFTVNKLGLK